MVVRSEAHQALHDTLDAALAAQPSCEDGIRALLNMFAGTLESEDRVLFDHLLSPDVVAQTLRHADALLDDVTPRLM